MECDREWEGEEAIVETRKGSELVYSATQIMFYFTNVSPFVFLTLCVIEIGSKLRDHDTGDKGPNNHWAHWEHIEIIGNM